MEDKGMARTKKELPAVDQPVKEVPAAGIPENTIMINGKPFEIKATKLKYFRNGTAGFYKLIDTWPMDEIMAIVPGTLGDDRDGDKALMDWLIAATDDVNFVRENYDDFDTGVIEKILLIFKRLNRIDEKADKLKNLMAERKGD